MNSFSRFLGLEPLVCDVNTVEELKGVLRGKRCGVQLLFIFFSTRTISVSFNRSSARTNLF